MGMVRYFPVLKPVEEPVCSICIANFNGVNVLADCIDSIGMQAGDMPVEIIVHDDASTDGSVEWIRRHYPGVMLLASDENVGFCRANNRMIERARGEYVLLLNNDAALYSDALLTLIEAIGHMPQGGVLTLPQYDWGTGRLVDRGCFLDPFYNPSPNLDPERSEVAYGIGACLFAPRTLWEALGGLPEWMESLAEDMYFCCLARLQGMPMLVCRKSGYRHRQGVSFGGNRAEHGRLQTSYRRRSLSERNKTACMIICTPTLLVWPLLSLHLCFLMLEAAVLSVVKRDARLWSEIYGAALIYCVRNFAELRRRRREIQGGRRVGLMQFLGVFVLWPRKISLLTKFGFPHFR